MQFKLRRLPDYSRESLLDDLKRVAQLLDQTDFSQAAFREHSRVSPSTISRVFGSWNQGLEAAGLRAASVQKFTQSDAIAEITRVAMLLSPGEKLTISHFQRYSQISYNLIRGLFGSWRKALQQANLEQHFDDSSQKVPRSEIIFEIQRVASLIKTDELTIHQFEQHSRFGSKVARKEFGSWHKAMQKSGLSGSPRGEVKNDDECFENLLAVWTHYGRPPTLREMARHPSMIGAHVYTRKFGSWIQALEAFTNQVQSDNDQPPESGLQTTATTSTVELINPITIAIEKKVDPPVRLPESERREIRLGLRYAVLNRDRFRCVICGRSPATDLGVILHIDHIVAWSKGGKTVLENLRTACSDCNLGKGAQ
jgi:hypothetical protein